MEGTTSCSARAGIRQLRPLELLQFQQLCSTRSASRSLSLRSLHGMTPATSAFNAFSLDLKRQIGHVALFPFFSRSFLLLRPAPFASPCTAIMRLQFQATSGCIWDIGHDHWRGFEKRPLENGRDHLSPVQPRSDGGERAYPFAFRVRGHTLGWKFEGVCRQRWSPNAHPAGYEQKWINPTPKYCSIGMSSLKACPSGSQVLSESDWPRESHRSSARGYFPTVLLAGRNERLE